MLASSQPPTSPIDFLWEHDQQYSTPVLGIDEVGRGALVGSVVAACVILDPSNPIVGLRDSKKLSEKKRLFLKQEILKKVIAYSIAECSAQEIDQHNILQASLKAMFKAIQSDIIQKQNPSLVLVDGNKIIPFLKTQQITIVKGDSKSASIAAASILAKVFRDQQMRELDLKFPQYGFNKHKGYLTQQHLQAIRKFGYTKYHRKSFQVKALL